jgi:hypothetical protein
MTGAAVDLNAGAARLVGVSSGLPGAAWAALLGAQGVSCPNTLSHTRGSVCLLPSPNFLSLLYFPSTVSSTNDGAHLPCGPQNGPSEMSPGTTRFCSALASAGRLVRRRQKRCGDVSRNSRGHSLNAGPRCDVPLVMGSAWILYPRMCLRIMLACS